MALKVKHVLIYAVAGTLLSLALPGMLVEYPELELAFEIGLIGLFVGVELIDSTSLWNRRFVSYLRLAGVAGVVVFSLIVLDRFMIVLGT